jgi:hypothetical protein
MGGGSGCGTSSRLSRSSVLAVVCGPSRPSGSSSAGGATSRSKNQDLPPFIPNPTLGYTGRPPGSFGGMTPGPRNENLAPVIPNSILSGGA